MTRHLAPFATLSLAAALALAAPLAQANLLSNGSLEATTPSAGYDGSYCYNGYGGALDCGVVPSWSGSFQLIRSNSGAWGTPSALANWNAAFGSVLMGLQNGSAASQSLALAPGQYELRWSDAGRASYQANRYEVRFGSTSLGSFDTAAGQGWAEHVLSFQATGAGVLTFDGVDALPGRSDGTSFIDNLVLSASAVGAAQVPEPQTLALVTLALLGLGAATRCRRLRQQR